MNHIYTLTLGPIVGHCDIDHARVWGRAELRQHAAGGRPQRVFGIARIREDEGDAAFGRPQFFKMNPNFDLTGIAVFSGLEADTAYHYQMGYFFSDQELYELDAEADWDWQQCSEGRLRTASADKRQARELVFGSCRYLLKLFGGGWFDDRGDKTFRSVLRQIAEGRDIQKLLMIGDQIYADDLNVLAPDTSIDEFFCRYRDAFSQPYLRQLMSQVSTYMTLDDHEVEDNWPTRAEGPDFVTKYPAAVHAYQTYQVGHSSLIPVDDRGRLQAPPERFYYTFRDGCMDVFVTDTRTERRPDVTPPELISERQLCALLDWLADGSERVKLVASAVPFFPDARRENTDKWSGFLAQRDRVIEQIRQQDLRKVVFLSGDVHCSLAAQLNIADEGESEQYIYSVISSAFFWPYPHMKRQEFQLAGHVASASNERAYPLGVVSDVCSDDNFTRLKVSPLGLDVEVFGRKGEPRHQAIFQF